MDRTSRDPRGFAFTLVELLVVVAIIAVLAAILLPSLSKARARAQSVLCLNNNKGMMLGATLYADENAGWLPNTGRWSCAWMIKMAPYVGEDKPNLASKVTDKNSPEKKYEIFRCPTNFEKPRRNYYSGTYSYNLALTSQMQSSSTNWTNPAASATYQKKYVRRLDAIDNTSVTVLIGDGYYLNIDDWAYFRNATNPALGPEYTRYHHEYTLNFAICDGSALNLRRGQRNDLLLGVFKNSKLRGFY